MPCGWAVWVCAIAACTARPMSVTFMPAVMLTASIRQGAPLKRVRVVGGSTNPRRMSAISRRYTDSARPGAWSETWPICRMDWNSPVASMVTRSPSTRAMPPGCSTFCAFKMSASCGGVIPNSARRALENSMKMRSACAPYIWTLATESRRSSRSRACSA